MPPVVESAKKAAGKVTAKATSETLAKAAPDRLGIIVCNPSTKEVWVALGATAVKEEGIWLKKESGVLTLEGYSGVLSLITSEGEGTVTYSEW